MPGLDGSTACLIIRVPAQELPAWPRLMRKAIVGFAECKGFGLSEELERTFQKGRTTEQRTRGGIKCAMWQEHLGTDKSRGTSGYKVTGLLNVPLNAR